MKNIEQIIERPIYHKLIEHRIDRTFEFRRLYLEVLELYELDKMEFEKCEFELAKEYVSKMSWVSDNAPKSLKRMHEYNNLQLANKIKLLNRNNLVTNITLEQRINTSLINGLLELLSYLLKQFKASLSNKDSQVVMPRRYKILKLTEVLFSAKTQEDVFVRIMADWDEEIFEALKKDKDVSLLMINVRNTYAFIIAMWQKSPLGDLLEYVRKIAS